MSRSHDCGSVAIAHDQITTAGGAERVAFELARTFNAPIYAAAVNQSVVPEDVEAHCITESRVGKRAMDGHYLAQDLYQMLRWQHVEALYEFDVVIQNKTNPYWFVPRDTQTVVRYCHSTPRGMYDQFYSHGRSLPSRIIKTPMRPLYRTTVDYADAWIANSELVQRRLERYWSVPSRVVHPPVETRRLSPAATETAEGFYVALSRLRDHKRLGEICEAFRGRDAQLVVAGEGPDRERLEAAAPENVEFAGYVSEDEKARLLSRACAVVFAAENEDFGIVPIEAMAAGTPVIGINDGFTKHQIIDEQNGLLFARGHLPAALDQFEARGVEWSEPRIERFADRFAVERFRAQLQEIVAEAVADSRVTVEWEDAAPEVVQ